MSRVKPIPGGGIRVEAVVTRADAVFPYRLPDGSTRREFRPASEVLKADSLESLKSAPVTDLHPRERIVTISNRRRLERGIVGDNVRTDDSDSTLVVADLIVTDSQLVSAVRSKARSEVSCGYTCRLDATPGTSPSGEPYDVVQRSITYNHVAVGPTGWARAGRKASIRLDEQGAEVEDLEARIDSNGDEVFVLAADEHSNPPKGAAMDKITIDGVEYDPTTPAFAQAFAKYEKSRAELQARHDAATEEVAKIKGELKETVAKLDAATAPEAIDALVAERGDVVAKAKAVAGEGFKADGLTPDEIRKAALAAKGVKLDGKSEDYIAARFDAAVEVAEESGDDDKAAAKKPERKSVKTDSINKVDADTEKRLSGIRAQIATAHMRTA